MLGSIYIGLSGLNAYSKGLQTISYNVANLNSPGFKASSYSFTDMFSYGGLTGGAPQGGQQQVGTGVRYGGESVDYRQGDLRQSGGNLDLAIQGDGFLVLLDQGRTYYARTGQFEVDAEGFVADKASGHRLAVLNGEGQPVAVNVDASRTNPPTATSRIRFAENLSADISSGPAQGPKATVANIAMFDASGTRHVWKVEFTPKTSPAGEWALKITDQNGATVAEPVLKFNGQAVDPTTAKINVTTTAAGGTPIAVELDFSGVTSFNTGSSQSIRSAEVDGNALGSLVAVAVDADGQVKLSYSNEKTELLGPIAIADFTDAQQLERVGAGLYSDRGGADVRLRASGGDGVGRLVSGQVEASNVDLSQQFGDLILVQRGFQASSQVISVSNDMIQQLFGIRGQG